MFGAIDAGGSLIKVATPFGLYKTSSIIGEYRERKGDHVIFGDDDKVIEYEGNKYYAGTIAQYESKTYGSLKGSTKAHQEGKLRILIAIHQYFQDNVIDLVVGQPLINHTPEQKKKIIKMLEGQHIITINDEKRSFYIRSVSVGVEGASALLSNPVKGKIKVIDCGSGTINMAALKDLKFISRDSTSIGDGMETIDSNEQEIARMIYNQAIGKAWGEKDIVFLTGGGAEKLFHYVREYFPNTKILRPLFDNKIQSIEFANVIGFYKLGEVLYG